MAGVFLGLGFCLLYLQTSEAHGGVSAFEVESYREDFGVSASKAEGALETQAQGAGMPIRLDYRLGRAYAGIWFDNDKGEFVVPVLSEAHRATVDSQFDAVDLREEDFRIVSVQSSWEELEAAQERINHLFSNLITEGAIRTALDAQTNSVVIYETEDIGKAAQAALRRQAGAEAVAVDLRKKDIGRFQVVEAACNMSWKTCDAPLRGGIGIGEWQVSGTDCTAGFKATGNVFGKRFVLTAGHCVLDPFVQHVKAYDSAINERYIGNTEEAYWGGGLDIAKINATGSQYWDVPVWPTQVVEWGLGSGSPKNSSYEINAESYSYKGQYVCHSGISTGSSCGFVSNLGVTVSYFDPEYNKTITVNNLTEAYPVCIEGGDSGGPVYTANTALGITNFRDAELPSCANYVLYTEITNATDALGVSVGPRIGAPPPQPTWHSPYGLGGQIVEEPDAASWSSGRLDVFARGTNDALHTKYYSGGNWSGWVGLSGPALGSGPGAVSWGANRIDVVAREKGTTGNVLHWWYDGSKWNNENLGGEITGSPDISSWGGGRLDIFARGKKNNDLVHKWFANGSWSSWESLGGTLTSGPGAVSWGANRIDVVGRTTNADVAHWWYDGTWHGDNLGGIIVGDPDISSWGSGRLDVFARGTNDALHHKWYNGTWSGWENKGGTLTSGPGAVSWGQDRIDIFGRATDGSVAQWWYGL